VTATSAPSIPISRPHVEVGDRLAKLGIDDERERCQDLIARGHEPRLANGGSRYADSGMAAGSRAPDATYVLGLRTRLAPPTRVLLDMALAGFLVLLWRTESVMAWLLLAYITVACRAFLGSGGRATVLRATLVTLIGGWIMLRFVALGDIPRNDAFEVPLLALLAYLFAGFAAWRSRVERVIVLDRERLAKLIDSLPLATAAFDAQDRIVTWNRTAEALFGWSAPEVVGRANPIVQPDDQASSDELHQRIRRGEILKGIEVERRSADGTVLELSVFTAMIDTGAGPSGGFLVMYDDIRERKRAQRERDEAQSRYRQLVEALPLVTYIDSIDDSATNLFTSPQVVDMLGWKLEDWVADPHFFESLPSSGRRRTRDARSSRRERESTARSKTSTECVTGAVPTSGCAIRARSSRAPAAHRLAAGSRSAAGSSTTSRTTRSPTHSTTRCC